MKVDKELSFGKVYVFAVPFHFCLESTLMTSFLVFCPQSAMRVIIMAGQTLALGLRMHATHAREVLDIKHCDFPSALEHSIVLLKLTSWLSFNGLLGSASLLSGRQLYGAVRLLRRINCLVTDCMCDGSRMNPYLTQQYIDQQSISQPNRKEWGEIEKSNPISPG